MPSLGRDITAIDFRARFPEFTSAQFTNQMVQSAVVTAKSIDSTRREATLYLAAHLASVWRAEGGVDPDGGSGAVSAETIGPRTVQYLTQAAPVPGSSGSQDAFFERTSYGRTYMLLRDSSPRRVMPLLAE